MHVLFVHQNFPAQFGHLARTLVRDLGWRCTAVARQAAGGGDGVELLSYQPQGGATAQTHYCTRTFENAVAHCHGVYKACRQAPDLRPDLIVGHSGFGSTLFLRELYACPIINYFEYFYRAHDSDLDFRPEFPPAEIDMLRCYCRNAMILLDLENCDAGYCPTAWQKSLLPAAFSDKVQVIFDGVDTAVWQRRAGLPREIASRQVSEHTRIVTYVSRGLESMRGFDIFMQVAKRIYQQLPGVLFVVVGSDQVFYGGDLKQVRAKTFREHVLGQDDYDLSKFVFTGMLPPEQLARLLSVSDLHIYLTVPFVLSWSLLDALACGCTVVASNTAAVREVIVPEQNGLLADFYDLDRLTELSLRVLRDPAGHRFLGAAGAALVRERYALTQTLPRMIAFYQAVLTRDAAPVRSPST